MKYFTPDLLARFRSTDEAVAETAADEWDRCQKEYLAQLELIKGDLPESFRTLLQTHYLHDAEVLTIGANEARRFSIFLKLDSHGKNSDVFIELKYTLTGSIQIKQDTAGNAHDGKPLKRWLYDELHRIDSGKVRPTFVHSILLSGGWIIDIPFIEACWTPWQEFLDLDDIRDRSPDDIQSTLKRFGAAAA